MAFCAQNAKSCFREQEQLFLIGIYRYQDMH